MVQDNCISDSSPEQKLEKAASFHQFRWESQYTCRVQQQVQGIQAGSPAQRVLSDPYYRRSGLHGGNLDIHADFNKYTDGYTLDRRVNSFIY
jgi:hypothetical protein